jgi:APA family basic amino acid/polyamine antiporter
MNVRERDDHGSALLPRVLGPVEAFCVVVGSVIGSGIFLVPAGVARDVPFVGGIALVWIVGGIFSAAGALTLAELGAMMPHAGGPYVYLRAAYGRIPAFLFGWAEFTVVRTGSMATLAAAFARYFVQLLPPPQGINGRVWQAAAAVVAIAIVTGVNILGTRRGGTLQVIGTVLKVGGVAALMLLPILLRRGSVDHLAPVWPTTLDRSVFTGMMAAMVGVLWAYDGWVNITPLAEEIRDPGRNIPRSLIVGMVTLIAVYLGTTLAYHYVLPMVDVAAANKGEGGIEKAVAAVYCRSLLGDYGVFAISLLVMCSTFISLNGNALTGPRAYFAMARDGLLPRGLGRIHPRFQTPSNAVLAQGSWASLLTIAGTALIVFSPPETSSGLPGWVVDAWKKLNETPLYDLLYTYVIFGANLFYLLAIASVFVLRAKMPDLPRPYRTWGYPFTPLLYVAAAILLLGNMLVDYQSRVQSATGLGLILLGLPAFFLLRRPGHDTGHPSTFDGSKET